MVYRNDDGSIYNTTYAYITIFDSNTGCDNGQYLPMTLLPTAANSVILIYKPILTVEVCTMIAMDFLANDCKLHHAFILLKVSFYNSNSAHEHAV